MALPTSGSISIDDIKAELGITGELSLTDSRVRSLAGKATGEIMIPNDLWGKSARTIQIYVVSHQQVSMGGGPNQNYYDRITFGVSVSDGAVPSSYSWGGDVWGSSATVQFTGPTYNLNGWTYQTSGWAEVSVVIAGQTLTVSKEFTYTAGDTV